MIRYLTVLAFALGLVACTTPPASPRTPGNGSVALPEAPPPPTVADEPLMCTMDAKLCPDGSYVSRNPAKGCAFNPCPGTAAP